MGTDGECPFVHSGIGYGLGVVISYQGCTRGIQFDYMTILHIADDLQRIAYLRISSVYEVLFIDVCAGHPALALEVGDVVPFGIMVDVPHQLSHQDHEPVAASSGSVQ